MVCRRYFGSADKGLLGSKVSANGCAESGVFEGHTRRIALNKILQQLNGKRKGEFRPRKSAVVGGVKWDSKGETRGLRIE